jgi:uncharacterized membrane protein
MAVFLQGLLRGRMFGHPIHAMLVHFPSALFPTGLALDLLALILKQNLFAVGGFFCLAGGVFGGSAAVLFGALDYFRLPSTHPAWKKASLHALFNVVWLMLFGVLFILRIKQYPNFQPVGTGQLIFSAVGVAGLLFSNFLGGELVFRHRIGIMEEEK